MRKFMSIAMTVLVGFVVCGCTEPVPQGSVGKVLTAGGWSDDIHSSGRMPSGDVTSPTSWMSQRTNTRSI